MSNLYELKRNYYEKEFRNRSRQVTEIFTNCFESQENSGETRLMPVVMPKSMEELVSELLNKTDKKKPFFKGYKPDFYFRNGLG